MKRFVQMQDSAKFETIYCIVDLHAIHQRLVRAAVEEQARDEKHRGDEQAGAQQCFARALLAV